MAFGKLSTYFHQRRGPIEFRKKTGVRDGAMWEARLPISEKEDLVVRLSDFSAAGESKAERRSAFFIVPSGVEVVAGAHEMLSHDLLSNQFHYAKGGKQPAEIPHTHLFVQQLRHSMALIVEPKRTEANPRAIASWLAFVTQFKQYSRKQDRRA